MLMKWAQQPPLPAAGLGWWAFPTVLADPEQETPMDLGTKHSVDPVRAGSRRFVYLATQPEGKACTGQEEETRPSADRRGDAGCSPNGGEEWRRPVHR